MKEKRIILLQDQKNCFFKSERLRKVIKAALEEDGIYYVYNKYDEDTKIAHILYPYSSSQFDLVYNNNKKIVMSLFYTEGEYKGALSDLVKSHDLNKLTISKLKLNEIYKVDKVLVPCDEFKNVLINKGVNRNKIKVLPPGANYKIYKYLPEKDMQLARRYFSINENDRIVLSFGNLNDKSCIDKLYTLARMRPDIKIIYFITNNINTKRLDLKIRLAFSKKPSNIYFTNFVDINIYRSILKNARCLVYFNSYLIDEVQLLEAFSSELQVFALDQALPRRYIESDLLLHSDDLKDLYKLITDFLDYKISNTISKAYDYVVEHDVKNFGEKLDEIYSKLEEENNYD